VATRLPYYTGTDDVYSLLMEQYAQEQPYYSAGYGEGFTGGYDTGLYERRAPAVVPESGLLYGDGGGGFTGGPDPDAPNPNATPGGFSFGGLIGGGSTPASTTTPGSVSTGLGGFSLSPEGVVTANTINVPGATALGFLTGMPLGLIANVVNQGAGGQAASQTQAMADTMGINATPPPGVSQSAPATAGPGGTGGAAATAAAAAAATAAAAGLSAAAQGAASQAAANAVVANNATPSQAAAAGAAAAGQAGLASESNNVSTADAIAAAETANAVSLGDAVGIGVTADGGGGGGGAKIICTKLHELGKMPTEIYEADQAFGALLIEENPETYYGYVRWAQHVVRWMSRDDLFGKFVVFAAYTIATPWSIAMAEEMGLKVKSNCFGRFLLKRGLQFCQMIGKNQDQRSIQNV